MYDWRELQRWSISEALLPSGSVVQFRQQGLWEKYRLEWTSALGIVCLQAALIAGLLVERRRRRQVAELASKARAETGLYRENLAHLARIHTVSQMSAAIAHEVNQPLVAIKNYSVAARGWLVRNGVSGTAKVQELLDKIEIQALRAGDVLQSLRTMVKKHEPEVLETRIGGLVSAALKLVEIENRNNCIRIEALIAPDLPPVSVDGIQIQQVVLNLIRNGIEAIEEAGGADGMINVSVLETSKDKITVSVGDNGPGIKPEIAKKIFDPFFTTKRTGLGVGLSICRAIIEAHNGQLILSSTSSRGCVFEFTLPVANGKG
jgi:C4-dicarboxylate-specific signal transduction histidine kinase